MTTTASITVTIDKADAERLIGLAGGTRDPRGGYDIIGHHYWQTDEALMDALYLLSECNGIDIDG